MLTTSAPCVDGPLHAGEDPGLGAAEPSSQTLPSRSCASGRDAPVLAGGRPLAMVEATCVPWPTVVGVVRVLGEVLLGDLPAREVRVGLVDAGVEHGDLDALAGVPGLPRGGRADLGGAAVEGGAAQAVEPDPGHAGVGEQVAERGAGVGLGSWAATAPREGAGGSQAGGGVVPVTISGTWSLRASS